MRRFACALAVLCFCVALFQAAPAPQKASVISTKPAPVLVQPGFVPVDLNKPTEDPEVVENQLFGRLLLNTCFQIVEMYIRPVTYPQLLSVALKGLYAKTGRPLAENIKEQLDQAKTDAALLDLLARARKDSGSTQGLAEDLIVCFQAIAASLDPYTKIVTDQDNRLAASLELETDGFGLEIAPHIVTDALRIKAVAPGGPAQRGGLRPGDAIRRLNGQMVKALPAERVDELLQLTRSDGPPPPPDAEMAIAPTAPTLQITYNRVGTPGEQTVTLKSRTFRAETVFGVCREEDNSWNYFLDHKARIAQVRVATLSRGTAQELREAVADLRGQKLRGLILDLRWCPGGFLDEAVDCARVFLHGEKVISTVKSRNRDEIVHRANKEGGFTDFPMVVLVNGESTGGAELIAAALKDHGRAAVGGQRSYGKASVQTPVQLGLPYTGMRLTSGTFLRPNGKNLHRFAESRPGDDWGVCPDPDLECRLSPAASRALKEAWLLQTLRPGPSRERLLLDDVELDVARQMALTALLSSN
jgi:carboxyl-terminal processing protease